MGCTEYIEMGQRWGTEMGIIIGLWEAVNNSQGEIK